VISVPGRNGSNRQFGWPFETKIRMVGGQVSTGLAASRSDASARPDRTSDRHTWPGRETGEPPIRLDCRQGLRHCRVALQRIARPSDCLALIASRPVISFEASVCLPVVASTSRRPVRRAGAADHSRPGSDRSGTTPADAFARTAFCSSPFSSCHRYQPLCTSARNCREITQDAKVWLAGRILYGGVCPHRCSYCYVAGAMRKGRALGRRVRRG